MNNERTEQVNHGLDLKILLHDLMMVARRRWIAAVVMVAVFSGLLCLQSWRSYRPQYQASATFTVYVANPLQSEIRGYNTATAEQMATTFPYILTSSALKDMVARDLEIPAMPPVRASVMDNTNIFTLTVTAREPRLAYDALQSVIEHYPDVADLVVGPTVMNLLNESGVATAPSNSRDFSGAIRKGVVLGLALWAVMVLGMVLLRSTVHNEEELRRVLSTRCMGVIPQVRRDRGSQAHCPLLEQIEDRHGFTESVRLLRLRVQKEMESRKAQVLMVSSAVPGEGKTTVSINLGKSLALHGKKVLLIDCDLRNPSVAKNLGAAPKAGLADYLRGKAEIKKAMLATGTELFDVIAAGSAVDNAAELLAGKKFSQLMTEVRKKYDFILLDTPPASLLSDASEIGDVADEALLVVRQNYSARAKIMEGARTLADSGLHLLGCTLNYAGGGVLGESGYGYGDSRYYKHYREYSW